MDSKNIKCQNCNQWVSSSDHFCSNCGTILGSTVFCPSCRKVFPSGTRYCPECGTPLPESRLEDSFVSRVLCSDGTCIGVVENGSCKVCGKAWEPNQSQFHESERFGSEAGNVAKKPITVRIYSILAIIALFLVAIAFSIIYSKHNQSDQYLPSEVWLLNPPPANYAHVATTEKIHEDYVRLQKSKDHWEVCYLLGHNKVLSVPNGTKVKVLKTSSASTKIAILEGRYKDREGWVENTCLSRVDPNVEEKNQIKKQLRNLRASVDYRNNSFVVNNEDNFDWGKCLLELNTKFFVEDQFEAGTRRIIKAQNFRSSDGSRFDVHTMKPQTFAITCTFLNGIYGVWERGWKENIVYSKEYPRTIPKGYSKTVRGKYRIVEHNNNRHFLLYDANNIKMVQTGIEIYPPAYLQEYFMGTWWEQTYHEAFKTIYAPEHISVLENHNPPKRVVYPEYRRPKN